MEQWMIKLADEIKSKWNVGVDPAEQARKDLEAHKGWTANVTWNPLSWLSLMRGGNQVNEKWLQEQASKGLGYSKQEKDWNIKYQKALHGGASDALDNAIRKDTAALHIGSKISDNSLIGLADTALRFVPGLGWTSWSEFATGDSAEGHLQDYKRQYADKYGNKAAENAEKWMRLAGNTAGVTSAVAAAATLGAATPASAGTGTSFLARSGRVLNGAAKTYASTRGWGAGFKAVGDQLTNGGQNQEGITGVLGNGANLTGHIVDSMPGYRLTMGMLSPAVRGTTAAMSKVYGLGWAGRAGQGLFNYAVGATPAPAGRAMGALDTVGRTLAADTIVSPMLSGVRKLTDTISGKKQGEYYWGFGPKAADIAGSTISLTDTGYTLLHAGNLSKQYYELRDNILKGGELAEQLKAQYGMDPSSTPQQVLSVFNQTTAASRNQDSMNMILKRLDPSVDWGSMNDAEINAKYEEFSPEQRRNAKLTVLNWQMSQGGHQDFDAVFNDQDLTMEDKRNLLSSLIIAEDKNNPWWKSNTLSLGVRAAMNGKGSIAAAAVEVSPVAREAVKSYGHSLIQAGVKDPKVLVELEMLRGQDRLNKALTKEDWQYILSPIAQARAGEQFNILEALDAAPKKDKDDGMADITKIASDMCKERMTKDGAYRADLLLEIIKRGNNSTTSSDSSAKYVEAFLKGDPKDMFANMDAKQFEKVTRYLMSGTGGGEGGTLSRFPPEKQAQIKQAYAEAAKARGLELCKENPLNIQVMSSLWAQSKGWDSVAGFLADPIKFWGSATLLLTGTFLIGGLLIGGLAGGDDDEEEDEEDGGKSLKGLMGEADKQRRLLTQQQEDPFEYLRSV